MIVPKDISEPITAAMWGELRERWPNYERLATAWALAPDLDTLDDLLAGRPVDKDRLSPAGLARAEEHRLVRLERPIELFENATPSEVAA